ncbi:MAG TPA: chromate transporter [Firmicutes bacterium]|nr:chromate transporter [Bacillota bacterium]
MLWSLFSTFFKIGATTFGGGHAMVPVIHREVVDTHGWLTNEEMIDMIAIAEVTPGPVAINTATFVGYKKAGLIGSIVATAGVVLPSFIAILIVVSFFLKIEDSPIVNAFFKGMRPTILALVAWAAYRIARVTLKEWMAYLICGGALLLVLGLKFHPIGVIALSAAVGLMHYGVRSALRPGDAQQGGNRVDN